MNVKEALDRFYEFLETPIKMPARIVLALLVVPLLLVFTQPLWNISMKAPQYPNGLSLDIFAHKVEGGNNGNDIREISTLNHYIGMAPISREQLSDLDWIPFALGVLVILALRVAAIGNVRMLVDLAVVSIYFSIFALARFVYRLYVLGHDLDPRAPVTVDPFMPAIFGTKQIANFTVTSLPRASSIFMGLFVGGAIVLTLWHLVAGRRAYLKSKRAS